MSTRNVASETVPAAPTPTTEWAGADHHCALYSAAGDTDEFERSFREAAERAGAAFVEFVPDRATPRRQRGPLARQLADRVADLAASNGRQVWCTADWSAARSLATSLFALRDLEREIAALLFRHPLKVLCRYDRRLLDDPTESALHDVHETVTTLGPPPDLRVSWARVGRLVLSGQIDGDAVRILDDIVGGADGGRLEVDLNAVDFIGVTAASILCRPALAGGQVALIGVPPLVSRILRLTDLEALPGVTVERQR